MNGFRAFLASFRFTGNRFDLYYGNIIGHGAGYPTADEVRRDIAVRNHQLQATSIALFR